VIAARTPLYARELIANSLNWASIEEPRAPLRLDVRYLSNAAAPALVSPRRRQRRYCSRAAAPQSPWASWGRFYDGDTLVAGESSDNTRSDVLARYTAS